MDKTPEQIFKQRFKKEKVQTIRNIIKEYNKQFKEKMISPLSKLNKDQMIEEMYEEERRDFFKKELNKIVRESSEKMVEKVKKTGPSEAKKKMIKEEMERKKKEAKKMKEARARSRKAPENDPRITGVVETKKVMVKGKPRELSFKDGKIVSNKPVSKFRKVRRTGVIDPRTGEEA